MTSALWRQTGAIWPLGVSCSLTWYDLGAIAHIIQTAGIKTVLEVGVEHGGLASYLRAYGLYTGMAYRGIDITLNALATTVRARDLNAIDQRDAWAADTVNEMRAWLHEAPRPALIICDGGNKPKELHLYAPLIRDGDVLIGHDYHHEYGDEGLRGMPDTVTQYRDDWLDDTLLCMFVRV
jgi:cephalosporin hydroxylase